MLSNMFPIWASVIALVLAQGLKPIFGLIINHKWDFRLCVASGSFPSSHTATVTALTLSTGLKEHFSSTLFAVTAIFSIIIAYDAMNVRYYSGKNIEITQKLLDDIEVKGHIILDDPIYDTHMKAVLGHKAFEVVGGFVLGVIVALTIFYLIRV